MSDQVDVSIGDDGRIGTVTIDRPDQLNALSTRVYNGIFATFEELEAAEVEVAILRTTGDRAFIAGADLKEIAEFSNRKFIEFQKNARRVHDYISKHPATTIAAVDGIAYGGGFEIGLATDMIVADATAEFGLPEIKLGLIPGGGATQRLPRIVGTNKAKELLQTGDPISAREAKTLGLVNELAKDRTAEEAARSLADTIASRAPLAVREAKRVVDQGIESSMEAGLSLEQAVTYELFDSTDAAEGIQTFLEDREPEFVGQ